MAQKTVVLIDTLSDRRLTLNLPDDVSLQRLLPALTRKLGLPEREYELVSQETGEHLAASATLAAARIREGETLRLQRVEPETPPVRAEQPSQVESLPAQPAPDAPPRAAPVVPGHRAGLPGWAWALVAALILVLAAAGASKWKSRPEASQKATTSTALARASQQTAATAQAQATERTLAAATVQARAEATEHAVATATAMAPAPGRIAFSSDRDGNFEIYVMNADGSGITRLTNDPAGDWGPAWSPDGGRLAFYSARDLSTEIYVMNADGSDITRLTKNMTSDWGPVWSPDGGRLAFCSEHDGNSEIYVMDADGSGVTRLTNNPAGDAGPAWSPDGARLAFFSDRTGDWEIYVMKGDGSDITRLTSNPASDWGHAWSPDGARLAFHSDRDGNSEIYVMDADGGGVTRLTNSPAADAGPAWSPDGARLAFYSDREGDDEIYVMNADGTYITRLTNNPAADWGPVWCPMRPAGPAATPVALAPTQTITPIPPTSTPQPTARPIQVRESDGAEMVFVPAGEFTMGSTDGLDHERPVHPVYVDAFWIDRLEVTNAQYQMCVAAGDCQPSRRADDADLNGDAQPVVGVEHDKAVAYCEWAGARLPTEAEWEKAARGTDARTYPWGSEEATCEYAVMEGEQSRDGCGEWTTWPVGSKPRGSSPYGALDMAGNVWEWVADWYGSDYYARSPARNPTGPESGKYWARRGGSWGDEPDKIRCTARSWSLPEISSNSIGFRCARSGSE